MNILHIISSPRGDASFSIKLGNAIVEKIQLENPGSNLKTTNLVASKFPHLEESHLTSFFTPAESRTAENLEAIKHSDQAIADLQVADIIVIGAPLYNFGIHSSLKAWIDHIARAGVTFKYSEKGVEGLLKNKKIYIALAAGGIYSEGPMQSYDFVSTYLKAFFGFIGITDIKTFFVEGSAIPEFKDTALQKGINSIVL